MTTSQFFVYRRSIAWTALIATSIWGLVAFTRMPQRQDPDIPIRVAVVLTSYPGARAVKVEQEVTRKVEKRISENSSVEKVYSLSREGLSIVYVELADSEKNAEQVWQDLRGKLASMSDLPKIGSSPVRPYLNKDFGD